MSLLVHLINNFYVKSINAMNWPMIDMTKLKNHPKMRSICTYGVDQAGADTFNLFYK